MLHVTAQARSYLRALHDESRAPIDRALRLAFGDAARVSMMMSLAEQGDEIIADERGPIFIIAAELLPSLDGMVIDVAPRTEGASTFLNLTLRPLGSPPAAQGV